MKLLKILLPLALCFLLLAGCGKKVELAGWEDYKDHPAQDVYAGEVAAPERIVMTRDERIALTRARRRMKKSYPPWAS